MEKATFTLSKLTKNAFVSLEKLLLLWIMYVNVAVFAPVLEMNLIDFSKVKFTQQMHRHKKLN